MNPVICNSTHHSTAHNHKSQGAVKRRPLSSPHRRAVYSHQNKKAAVTWNPCKGKGTLADCMQHETFHVAGESKTQTFEFTGSNATAGRGAENEVGAHGGVLGGEEGNGAGPKSHWWLGHLSHCLREQSHRHTQCWPCVNPWREFCPSVPERTRVQP